jgi:hypothetical protein
VATIKDGRGKTIAQQKALDKETVAMMFEGASLTQLAQLFSQDVQKVKKKLHGLEPSNMRAGHPIYSVAEAARRLVEPQWPIDEYIKRMNHADLPVLLKKEYWAGMRSRQLWEEQNGDLWRTDYVIEHISDLLKSFALPMKLASDTVERETGLNPDQRKIIIRLMDQTLANVHKAAQEMLENRRESRNGGSAANPADDDENTL